MVGTVKALIQQAANAAQASGNHELADLPWGDFDVIRIDD